LKRAIILGAGGLIGKTVAARFRAAEVPVVAVDLFVQKEEPGIQWVQGSVSDEKLLTQLLQEGDDIFHFAHGGFPGNPTEWEDGLKALDGLKKLCHFAAERHCRIIFPSSGGTVYGEAMVPVISEQHPLNPVSVYGLLKKMSEELIVFYGRLHELNYVVIRIANCYGSGFRKGKPQGIIGVAAQSILEQNPLNLVGSGQQIRDFIHAKDVAGLCARIFASNCGSVIVNVGSGKGHSMLDIVRLVEKQLEKPAIIEWLPARAFDVQQNVLDSTLAEKMFNWSPTITIEEGIAETCEQLKKEV